MLTRVPVAGLALIAATVAGSAAGAFDWPAPRQSLEPPYVVDVPARLFLAFMAIAVVGLLVAGGLHRALLPRVGRRWTSVLVVLVAVTSTAANVWGALYVVALMAANNPIIPVLNWVFFAVPVGLACLLARQARPPDRSVVTGLLVAVPLAAVHSFGWSATASVSSGLFATAVLGGFGVLLGLVPGFTALGDRPARPD